MGSASFRKQSRICHQCEFEAIYKQGLSRRGRFVRMLVLPRPHSTQRLGVVVSRKVGIAVLRNRLKRRVREWFRTHRASLPHGDCVVIISPQAASSSATDFRHDLVTLGEFFQRSAT